MTQPAHPPVVLAIGGALDLKRPRLLSQLISLAGGEDANLALVTTASGDPSSGELYTQALHLAGLRKPPLLIDAHERRAALNWENWQAIEELTAVFFTGGSQLRLTSVLGGTPLLAALQAAHRRGAVIAGTSAGAAALGDLMIAFGRPGASPRIRQAQFAPGLGFLSNVIIDQHFSQRNRFGRLIYAVAQHPGVTGVGIDENTAALITGDQLSVYGSNSVTLIDGNGIQSTSLADLETFAPFAVSGVILHVLTEGCSYNFSRRDAMITTHTHLPHDGSVEVSEDSSSISQPTAP